MRRIREFSKQDPAPIIEREAPLELRIRFNEESLQSMMDSVYAGERHLVESMKKWPKGTPKDVRALPAQQVDGNRLQKKIWVYEVERPRADLLVYWRHGDPDDRWVALWRDAVRGVLRESRSAEIYTRTTQGQSPTRVSGDLRDLWKGLVQQASNQRADGKGVAVPTSMYIGAEGHNAERVPFKGDVTNNLLLHFWPFVSPIFVPRSLRREGRRWSIDTQKSGYVFAVAEVGDLVEFADLIDAYWRRRAISSTDQRRHPRECEIDVAVEGGLAFLHALAVDRLDSLDYGDFFAAAPQVDIYHLDKPGRNVQLLTADSIRPAAGTLRRYQRVADSRWNVLFRRLLMRNVLDGLPWHARAAETLFARYPVEMFVCSEKSPPFARNFGQAAKEQFEGERKDMNTKLNLAGKVFDIVGVYVASRAERRSGVTSKQAKNDGNGNDAKKYQEAREKVATDAFLAIRGRNADEFVEYFVGSICSVPQFMGVKGVAPREGFIEIAGALHDSGDKRMELKNLTMLALSAHGWRSRSSDAQDTNTKGGTE